jgi:hypothetical protein
VTDRSFYSDRNHGPQERTLDELPGNTRRGLLSLLNNKISSNWFAHEFPEQCGDGNGIAGTDEYALADKLQALVPDATWPLMTNSDNTKDETVFDLIEWAAHCIEQPDELRWHD